MSSSTDLPRPRPPRPTTLPSRPPSIRTPPSIRAPLPDHSPSIPSPKTTRTTSTVAQNANSATRIVVQNSHEQPKSSASDIKKKASMSSGSLRMTKRPPAPVSYQKSTLKKPGSPDLAPGQSNMAPRNARATASVRSRPPPRPPVPPLSRRAVSQGSIQPLEPRDSTSSEEAAREARSLLTSSPLRDLGSEIPVETVAPSRVAPRAEKETIRTPGCPAYVAAFAYHGDSDAELTFQKGEGIMLLEEEANENGWVRGMSESGAEGYLPITYLED